jgi:hypothetical protein
MAISGAYFCIALLLLVLQIPIFIYRGKKNTWIFWGTLVATVGFVPISLMGLVMGGTSCGEASIYIAKRVAAFYLIAFALQLLSWPFDHKAEAIQSLKH